MKAAFYRSSTCDPWWWPKETCGPGTQSLNEVSGRRHEVESTMDIPGEQDVQFKIFTHLIIPVYFLSLQVLLFRFFPWTDCYISALVIKTLVLVFSGCDPHWPSAQNQGLIHTFARSFLLSPLPEVKWSEVAQSCPTLCNLLDCSLQHSSVHGIIQARVGGHFLLQRIFPTQGSNLGLPHCRQMLYHLSHQESPPLPDHILNWDIIRILGAKPGFSKRPVVVVQSLSHVRLLATPKWTALH